MHQCIKFILFWNDTLHASDGLSVQLDTAVCLLASRQQYLANKQTTVSDKFLLLYVQS